MEDLQYFNDGGGDLQQRLLELEQLPLEERCRRLEARLCFVEAWLRRLDLLL